jgi:DNA-binding XRE family transcriptional regulator
MILNERGYRITKAAADKLAKGLEETEARGRPADVSPKLWKAQLDGMRNQAAALQKELAAYDRLQTAGGKKHLNESIESLGLLLIQARIARGWTQRELAERLGLHHQKIQEYESSGYIRASVTRVNEVLSALGATATVDVRLADLLRLEEFEPKAEPKSGTVRAFVRK